MQNSICNLNVFILRYAGAIFIFTENEGFTRQEGAEQKQEGELRKERVFQAAWQPKPGQARQCRTTNERFHRHQFSNLIERLKVCAESVE